MLREGIRVKVEGLGVYLKFPRQCEALNLDWLFCSFLGVPGRECCRPNTLGCLFWRVMPDGFEEQPRCQG
jgi:hypothetical protein